MKKFTDKEKMLMGMPYFSSEEIVNDVMRAKKLCYKYNNLEPDKLIEFSEILQELIASIGKRVTIEQPFRCDYGYNIKIGNDFYSNYNLTILDCGKVNIGDGVHIGPNVSIFTSGHPVHFEDRKTKIVLTKPVTIGDNVWIGGATVINPGVKIGNNSVIGSGSVVTKDIPSNVVAVGNPCKVIKEITENDKLNIAKEESV